MRYFKYYRLLTLMHISRKNLGFVALFSILYLIQTNIFFGESTGSTYTFGPHMVFIVSLFVMIMYAFQIRFEPTNPLYQFPLTAKERTRYDYISVIFIYIAFTVISLIFFFSLFGLFMLLGNAVLTDGEEVPTDLLRDMYNLAHYLFMFALMMPLAYVESVKYRFGLGILFLLGLSLFHVSIYGLATKTFFQSGPVTSVLSNLPFATLMVGLILVLSVVSIFISYQVSLKLNSYK